MRDSATGRSRGFGFLTFKDPKTVNTVMVKEHFLDGKIVRPLSKDSPEGRKEIRTLLRPFRPRRNGKGLQYGSQIDPKRAIPRDEQEKTAKIFVGGVSQEASEEDFESFFAQFGRVVDATLMMDKDTGRPRGFGFVTFDSDAAVEKCLEYQPLEILGKQIEVKRAQPRGKMGEEDDFARGGRGRGKFNRDDRFGNDNNNQVAQGNQNQAQNMMGANGMSPQMMAQYWQRMQQYFSMMQQQMASNMMNNMGNMGSMGMGQMTPQMMMQMQQMQKMQGGNSPNAQGGMGNMGNMQGMNPQMMQQMMQMQQQQQQQGGMNGMNNMGGGRGSMGQGNNRGSFSAQEQMAFEQQKYEHQQQTRRQGSFPSGPRGGGFQNQNPQSWEGMYDDVPQPDGGHGSAGPVRNNTPKPPKGPAAITQASAAPANAPTGPKNPGKPTGGFRGGRGRYHPYGR